MDLKLDTNGDLAIENGDLVLISGIDETIQFLEQSLRLFATEWFLDETRGVEYFDQAFVKNPNPVALNGIFKKHICECPGVLELKSFSLSIDPSTRVLSLVGTVRATDGEADFSVLNVIPGG